MLPDSSKPVSDNTRTVHYLRSQVIKTVPLGIAYAIWAGVGIVLTSIV
ncbi:hypothetical protein KC220_21420, partial [Mycobacterium tuberculosis]|nr:hypothetical protein [Mycobacterium tuberculosis]